jgi:four helix bundle protein
MRSDKKNLIVDLTFDFSLDVINFSEKLRELKKFEMSSQIFRSGTSVGANTREAQNAESKKDFFHKFKIAAKEADEVDYWLEFCVNNPNIIHPQRN